jgi:hypothetical protein
MRHKMSYYTHILICWEGGHVLGYANSEKIKKIASKHVGMYEEYEKDLDVLFEEEKQKKLRKEELTDKDYEKHRNISGRVVSGTTICILKSIESGKALFEGTKGDLWMSGGIFNYTEGDTVLYELKDFFKELWDNKCFGRGDVICFSECEQSNDASILVLNVNEMEIHQVEKGEKWCWGLNW